jgi:hypothetical protein
VFFFLSSNYFTEFLFGWQQILHSLTFQSSLFFRTFAAKLIDETDGKAKGNHIVTVRAIDSHSH